MPIASGNRRLNRRVVPLDKKSIEKPDIQEINDTNIAIQNNQSKTTKEVVDDTFGNELTNINEKKEKHEKQKHKGPKLKPYEIYKFADKWDILLMILGTVTAVASGAPRPIMMWLFLSVTNSLVSIGKGNSTTTTDCYINAQSNADPITIIETNIKWYAALGAINMALNWMVYAFWMSTSERQVRRIRYELFKSIITQDIGWFDCRNADELSSRLTGDLDNIREGIGFRVADFLCLISRIIGTLIFSFYIGWKLTIVYLSFTPFIVLSFNILIRVIVRYTAMELKAYSTANAIVQEVFGAIRTVTAFNGQNKETARYEKNLIEGRRIGIQKGIMVGITHCVTNIILYGAIAIVFWYGPYLIRNDCKNYSAGHWMVIFISCFTSTFGLATVIPNIQAFAEALGAGGCAFEIIKRESKINIFNNAGAIPPTIFGDIEFENVHFKYPSRKDAPVLNGFNLKIPAGKTIGLCGSSGCGKSTTVNLLQRFYDPEEGKIILDGHDIRSINLKWLRSNIGIVSQEPVLFFGTIEDNIRYGKLDATEEEMVASAKMANAHDFIMQLPHNYKTLSGDKLSGGQKQRIAIARALISNPKILLLDEATSALDNQSEKLVQEALDRAKEGRTTIVIAHRLSTIKNVDIIFGLENGQVVEYGTHNELMQRKGLYYELVTSQCEREKEKEKEKEKEEDNDKENETGEELAEHADESEKHKTRRQSRRMSIMLRRTSVRSVKSLASEIHSEIGHDVGKTDVTENKPFFSMPFIFKILRLNSPEWLYLLFGGIAALIYGAVTPSFSLVFSKVFGALAETDVNKQEDQIRTYTYVVFLIGLASAICHVVSSVTLATAGEELSMRMRVISFKSTLRQEIGWFDMDENNLGALVTRLSSDAAALKGFTGPMFQAILNTFGGLITALVISFLAGWKLTFVILCFTPLMVFTGIVQGQQYSKARGKKKRSTHDAEEGGKHATQAIHNIRTVVSLHQENHFIQLYQEAFDRDFRSRMFYLHYISFGSALANSLMYFIHAGAFGYGIKLIQNKEMSFQGVFQVFSVVTFAATSIGRSASTVPGYSKGKASAERILELNRRQSRIDPDDSSGIKFSDVNGNIEFRDVQFSYPIRPKLRILRNFSLVCGPGATTALVGSSGSGKSTAIALMSRFYDTVAGTVFLDGHDIRTLNIQWFRSLLGIVQQEPVLFNLSICDNIAYGDNNRQVTLDEIEAAARKANIHDTIISLPEGYATLCGSKGNQLSGGQKQRIAIARALIRNPKILLFDEATSALDTKSERVVQEALDQARIGRTCLTIAHRLSTIRNSDQICVVDHGRIKESGRHEQLLQQQGIYYKLNVAQEHPENLKDK